MSSKRAFEAYNEATELSRINLKATDTLRLNIAMNFSVYMWDIKNDQTAAVKIGKEARENAIADIEELDGRDRKESENIISLIKANIDNWINEVERQNETM